ncbi:hypothetical protein SSX86_024736 [Deinandra increscens subsp. villosa]|uniref:RNA-binding protein AU-1/Ribonuclease E/G domain-containing protein n=1 Tax=Deinandra increscens subsp. villosa TaxID=3103831 RepID=A0AAP0CH89_9ASTR
MKNVDEMEEIREAIDDKAVHHYTISLLCCLLAKTLQPPGFGLTVRTVAAGHTLEELQKDLDGLLSLWKSTTEQAPSAALAADEGIEGAIPTMLHREMGHTLSVVQEYFNHKVRATGKALKNVIVIDIGGSFLGPSFVHRVSSRILDVVKESTGDWMFLIKSRHQRRGFNGL